MNNNHTRTLQPPSCLFLCLCSCLQYSMFTNTSVPFPKSPQFTHKRQACSPHGYFRTLCSMSTIPQSPDHDSGMWGSEVTSHLKIAPVYRRERPEIAHHLSIMYIISVGRYIKPIWSMLGQTVGEAVEGGDWGQGAGQTLTCIGCRVPSAPLPGGTQPRGLAWPELSRSHSST